MSAIFREKRNDVSKPKRSPLAGLLCVALLVTGFASFVRNAQANPVGEQLMAGEALFERNGNKLTISQGSDRAIIHWNDFSIDLGETTEFIQPGAGSAALNRVLSSLSSRLNGNLLANGQIFLVNPNGIVIGPSGRIDTASFLASTLDVSDAEFLAGGDMTFAGDSEAGVINYGTINAIGGDIFLIGRHVENHGLLSAPDGTVGLAAGEEVLIKAEGDERVFVQPKGEFVGGDGVTNTGTIEGATAELKAHGNMYALAINNSGTVRATGVQKRGGRVYLSAPGGVIESSGTIEASDGEGGGGGVNIAASEGGTVNISGTVDAQGTSQTGGEIVVTADSVNIAGSAELNASGITGGGNIFVGGGLQGQDAEIANAQTVYVDSGALIKADAFSSGDGGTIILWADDTMEYYGDISARAFGETGDGGFAEVSGKNWLHFRGRADLRSANGRFGDLLLDPGLVTVFDDGGPEPVTPDGNSTFGDGQINNLLTEANVTIATGDSNAQGPENILIEEGVEISWTTDSSLTFTAGRSIQFGTDPALSGGSSGRPIFDALGEGDLSFSANMGDFPDIGSENGISGTVGIVMGSGDLTMRGRAGTGGGSGIALHNSSITASGSSVVLEGTGGALGGNGVTVSDSSFSLDNGNLNITGKGGEGIGTGGHGIQIANSDLQLTSGDLTIEGTSATLGQGDGIFLSGTNNWYLGSGSDLVTGIVQNPLTENGIRFDNLTVTKTGVDLQLIGSIAGGSLTTYGSFDLQLLGSGVFTGTTTLNHENGLLLGNTLNSSFRFENGLTYTGGQTRVSGGTLTVEDGNVDLTDLLLLGDYSIIAQNGDVDLGVVDAVGYDLGIEGNTVTATSSDNNLAALQIVAGNAALTNYGFTQFGAWNTGGLTLDAQGGEIYLDDSGNHFGPIEIINGDVVTLNAQSEIEQNGSWQLGATTLTSNTGINLFESGNSFGDLTINAPTLMLFDETEITQGGTWIVPGQVTLATGSGGIILTDEGNELGDLSLFADFVELVEDNDITQFTSWQIAGDVDLTARNGASVILNNSNNSFGDLGITAGNLDLWDSTEITQIDDRPWIIDGNADLIASVEGVVQDITLENLLNEFGSLVIHANNLRLGSSTDVVQHGAWYTAGDTIINAPGQIVLLDIGGAPPIGQFGFFSHEANVLGDLAITAAQALVREVDDITDIDDGPAWNVAGPVILDATGNDVVLENSNNQLGNVTVNLANDVTIVEDDDIMLNTVLANGTLNLISTGSISLLSLLSAERLEATAAENIVLDNALNNIGMLGDTSAGGTIDIFALNGLTIDGGIVSNYGSIGVGTFGGDLTMSSGGYLETHGSEVQVTLYTNEDFINLSTIQPSTISMPYFGNWFVYMHDVAGSTFGNLQPDFLQYSSPFPTSPVGVGNGFLFVVPFGTEPPPLGSIPGLLPDLDIPLPDDLPIFDLGLNPADLNPITDASNRVTGLFAQNNLGTGEDVVEEEYEELYDEDPTIQRAGGAGEIIIGPDDGPTEFNSSGARQISPGEAPAALIDALTDQAIAEMEAALQ